MAKKKTAKPKEEKVEKIEVVDISQPTTAELSLRISALETRFSALVEAISKSKSVKGI
jgi:hypothetical protein